MTQEQDLPQKFTHSSIVDYVAQKHDLNKKQIKDIVDTYLQTVEKGVLLENRVPVGNFGKMYMHLKPATKERQGINPATGDAITISAKPASRIPKFSFTKSFKENIKNSK